MADALPPRHRKDGKPFKTGNVREDGDYRVGKYRTPEGGKFRKDDRRKRGKHEKGSKNLSTIWSKKLGQKLSIDGASKESVEWVVEALIRRSIVKSDRAAEVVLATAERIERAGEQSWV